MGMGFAPTWLRQVNPAASQNHFNHWLEPDFVTWAARRGHIVGAAKGIYSPERNYSPAEWPALQWGKI